MTTAADIINDAYREINVVPLGQTPSTDQSSEGLLLLNRLINNWFGHEFSQLLYDWQIPARTISEGSRENPRDPYDERQSPGINPYPDAQSRVLVSATTNTTIFMPEYPSNGARIRVVNQGSTVNLTLNANRRLIEDAASVVVDLSSVDEREWFYRADKGNWVRRADLAGDDEQPFAPEFDDLLVAGLAISLAPRYEKDVSNVTASKYLQDLNRFRAAYKQYTQVQTQWNVSASQSYRVDDGFFGNFIGGGY